MSDQAYLSGMLLGVAFGYFQWGTQLPFIENIKADADSEFGEPYVLEKAGSGQVAVFHGFSDDYDVCETARIFIQSEGGTYACQPASIVAGPKPWWKFWAS